MIKKIRSLLTDPELDYKSKSFVLLSVIALIGLFIAMISGILLGQSFSANLSVFIEFVLFSGIFLWAIYRNGIKKAMIIISAFLVFVFLPAAFFTSGGAAGGTPVWFAFSTLYIVMTLSGKPKAIFLGCTTVVVVVCWWIGYVYPETITEFTRKEAFFDSFFTLLIVGVVMTALVSYQALLFNKENERVNAQKKEIEELNRSQNRFFSSMSHEIRTPINSILGLNEVILRQPDASDEIVTDATDIQNAGKMLLALINDILDFSKVEAGKMDIVPVRYNVSEMMSEIVNMVVLSAKEKGLAFTADIDPDTPSVLFGDEIRIRQVIVNLLNNSVKYTETGSVKFHVRTEKAGDESIDLILSVTDTGIGIKEEVIPVLFDAFARMDQEKNRKIEGTGLGLSIVKQLVDLMGGEISVDSVYGKGSTFTVKIPQKVEDAKKIGSINIMDHAARRNVYRSMFTAPEAELLIVDDIRMNLTVEKKLLRETKIRIDTASSGREALEMTLKKRYDVILMDHLMPEMDGIECLGLIRSQEGGMCRDIPVIVLTANADARNMEMYRQAGFDSYLVKPTSGHLLEEALIRFLPGDKIIRGDD
ncbi:MAG: response regulator [Lachnospiraceae bacterium]|nr:response regulator [Lachnospiraceae bacterium]